jgi:hypothetical protein
MGTHQFEDKRIEAAHDLPRRRLILTTSRGNQRGLIEVISHVMQGVSTLTGMTVARSFWLQGLRGFSWLRHR